MYLSINISTADCIVLKLSKSRSLKYVFIRLVRELTIKNVTSTDSGAYVCKVKEQTASAQLRVVGGDENVKKGKKSLLDIATKTF